MNLIGRYFPGAEFLEKAAQFIPSQETIISLFEKIAVDPAGYTFFNNGDASRSFTSDLGAQLAGRLIIQNKSGYVLPYLHLINPNAVVNGQSLICLAVSEFQPEVAEALLEVGADPNSKSDRTYAYAERAKFERNEEGYVVRESFARRHVTPVCIAALRRGCIELAKKLLKAGADPDEVDFYFDEKSFSRETAGAAIATKQVTISKFDLPLSRVLRNEELVAAFLEAGAEVNIRLPNGKTILQTAVEANLLGAVHMLLEHGADLDFEGTEGYFFCYQAAKHNNLEMLRLLIDCGADPTLIGPYSESPLAEAFIHRNQEMVDLLLDSDASLDGEDVLPKAFLMMDGDNFVEILEMMLDSQAVTIPDLIKDDISFKDIFLAKTALFLQNPEQGAALVQRLRREGATISGAQKFIARERARDEEMPGMFGTTTVEDWDRAREALNKFVGGFTKGAM